MKKRIKKMIIETGVKPHLMGYVFICKSMELIVDDYCRIFNLHKDVYDPVARQCNTTSSRVERDIRNAIEMAFTKNTTENKYQCFQNLDNNKGKPTNKEFLAILANEFIK